jgi:hypothetical protein
MTKVLLLLTFFLLSCNTEQTVTAALITDIKQEVVAIETKTVETKKIYKALVEVTPECKNEDILLNLAFVERKIKDLHINMTNVSTSYTQEIKNKDLLLSYATTLSTFLTMFSGVLTFVILRRA